MVFLSGMGGDRRGVIAEYSVAVSLPVALVLALASGVASGFAVLVDISRDPRGVTCPSTIAQNAQLSNSVRRRANVSYVLNVTSTSDTWSSVCILTNMFSLVRTKSRT